MKASSNPAERASARPQPQQRRSAATVDRILEVASALLDEVGFDRLTTNLVCERAGLTPPALYRHFAGKYAVMEELGRRLMEAQNLALFHFLEDHAEPLLAPDALAAMLVGQCDLTLARPGGRWIMRSLHATPALAHVRLQSHQAVSDSLARRHAALAPGDAGPVLERRYRVAVEAGYAMIELMLDRPDFDRHALAADAAAMIAALLAQPL
jgi:AcrR family transcriptional regulator